MKDIFILIPVCNPEVEKLEDLITELKDKFPHILVVNDGSTKEYNEFFSSLEESGVEVFTNYLHLGIGRSIKNGFNYILSRYPKITGVVTANCNNTYKDIYKCASLLLKNKDKLIIGKRDFNSINTPKSYKTNNKIINGLFKLLVNLNINDSTSLLRGMSKEAIIKYFNAKGEGLDYLNNVLIKYREKDLEVMEFDIDSNFQDNYTIKDMYYLYKLFISYILSSSFIIDIIIFTILMLFNLNIIASVIIARVISTIYNYKRVLNKVFKKYKEETIKRYYLLVIFETIICSLLTYITSTLLSINPVLVKINIDIILLIIAFYIKNNLIFGGVNEK